MSRSAVPPSTQAQTSETAVYEPQTLRLEIEALFLVPNHWQRVLELLAIGLRPNDTLADKRERAAARRVPKRSEHKPCPGCGRNFDRRPRGKLRTFCTDKCRQKHHNRGAPTTRAGRKNRRAA